ncbi:MAG: transglycosylase SLT domain-containing protein [Cyanobacteriota bacterium]
MFKSKFICLLFLIPFLFSCNKNNFNSTSIPEKITNYSKYNDKKIQSFILKNGSKVNKKDAEKLSGMINFYSKKYNTDVKLVLSLIAVESAFQPKAVSYAGAKGLGQLMPGTAKQMGVKNVFEPEENIEGTLKYIEWLKKRSGSNNLDIILASYNMGYGNVSWFLENKKPFPKDVRKYVNDIKKLQKMVIS